MSAISGTIGGILQANAQNAATKGARKSQKEANALTRELYDESRGSTGHALFPTYTGDFEKNLSLDLMKGYEDSAAPLASFETSTRKLAGAETGAEQFTNDIFSGGITKRLLEEAQPVQAARLSSARQSSMDALNKTLAAIDAAQAGKGFTGDSFGNRMLRFAGTRSAGDAVSAAKLANLGEVQQIENYGDVTLPMQNLNLPYNMAQQAGQFSFMPQSNWLSTLKQRLDPLSYMKIGVSQPYQVTPLPTGVNSNPAASALAGVSAAGGTALNYYLQNQSQKRLLDALQQKSQDSAIRNEIQFGSPMNGADYGALFGGGGALGAGSLGAESAAMAPASLATDFSGFA